MFQGFDSTDTVENIGFARGDMVGSIIPISHIAKEVDWSNKNDVRELLLNRFKVSSLPFETRLRLYTDLMMALSIEGIVFLVEARTDRKRLVSGFVGKTIQRIMFPESEEDSIRKKRAIERNRLMKRAVERNRSMQ